MLIETAALLELKNTSAVTALVSSRIYYVKAPQDVTAPYAVISKISALPFYAHDGPAGLAISRLQISIFATTYAAIQSISTAIRAALECFTGTMGGVGGVYVGVVFFDNETDLPFDDEQKLYGVADDYRLIYNE